MVFYAFTTFNSVYVVLWSFKIMMPSDTARKGRWAGDALSVHGFVQDNGAFNCAVRFLRVELHPKSSANYDNICSIVENTFTVRHNITSKQLLLILLRQLSVCLCVFFPLLSGARVWVHSVPSPLAGHQPAGTDWELNITSSRDVRLFHAGPKLQQRAHPHLRLPTSPSCPLDSPHWLPLPPFPFLRIGTCPRFARRGANTVQEFCHRKRKIIQTLTRLRLGGNNKRALVVDRWIRTEGGWNVTAAAPWLWQRARILWRDVEGSLNMLSREGRRFLDFISVVS